MNARERKTNRWDAWRRLAVALGGTYVEAGFFKPDRVEVGRGGFTIVLDAFSADKVAYTRLRADFVSLDGLRLRLYPRGVLSDLATSLGMQDVEVGDAAFDRAFVIKGNDEGKLRALLGERGLRELISAQRDVVVLAVRDIGAGGGRGYVPADAVEFSCIVRGEIDSGRRLAALFDLVGAAMARLRAIGSASPGGLCLRCGYHLAGNVSGVCPECGQPLPAQKRPAGGGKGKRRRGVRRRG